MEIAPAATAMAPGITGGGSGRPRPTPLLVHTAGLIDKKEISVNVSVGEEVEVFVYNVDSPFPIVSKPIDFATIPSSIHLTPSKGTVPLIAMAMGRSGDKGDMANIGIICRDPSYYQHLKHHLTSQVVLDYMSHLIKGKVTRYEIPGIFAFNFLLTKSLGGGGLSSLLLDRQGKSYAQILLTLHLPAPPQMAHL